MYGPAAAAYMSVVANLAFVLPFYSGLGGFVLSVLGNKCLCYFQIVRFWPGEMVWLDGFCVE